MSRKDSQYRGHKCLNCNTPLDISERYCHHCGQLNSTKKLSVKDFFDEFLSNFYAYDSKIRNSLIYLFSKPGILPKRYIAGQRTTFANPFRLFLSVSIILFIVMSFVKNNEDDSKEISLAGGAVKINSGGNNENEETKDTIFQPKDYNYSPKDSIDKVLDTINYNNEIVIDADSIYHEPILKKNTPSFFDLSVNKIRTFKNFREKYPKAGKNQTFKELEFEDTFLNSYLYDKSEKFKTTDITGEALDMIKEKLPFLFFISIPIITLIFCWVFRKKGYTYTDHLIFTYTFYTFIFLYALSNILFGFISSNLEDILGSLGLFIIFPYYLYRSLRNFYGFSRWKTIFKFVLLHPLFLIIMTVSVMVMMSLGFILI